MKSKCHTPNCPTPRDAFAHSGHHHAAIERDGAAYRHHMASGKMPKVSKQEEAKPAGVRRY